MHNYVYIKIVHRAHAWGTYGLIEYFTNIQIGQGPQRTSVTLVNGTEITALPEAAYIRYSKVQISFLLVIIDVRKLCPFFLVCDSIILVEVKGRCPLSPSPKELCFVSLYNKGGYTGTIKTDDSVDANNGRSTATPHH
jgi:hypothetical protein